MVKLNNNAIIDIRGISRHFGKTLALDDVTLSFAPGRIVGLLGANGSGKSTLLRHIIGLYPAQKGACLTFGIEAERLTPLEMAKIGYVHQEGELLDWMTVRQLIRYVSAYYPNWNMELQEKYISDFDIDIKGRIGSLSPGERQKVAILLAIGFEPELLILDEPAAALDPVARAQFLDLLLEIIQDQERTIIISSHILSDVEKIIDHAVIMKQGQIICDKSFDELREEFCQVRLSSLNGQLADNLGFQNVLQCDREGSQAILILQGADKTQVENRAQELNCQMEIKPLSLDEIYRLVIREDV